MSDYRTAIYNIQRENALQRSKLRSHDRRFDADNKDEFIMRDGERRVS